MPTRQNCGKLNQIPTQNSCICWPICQVPLHYKRFRHLGNCSYAGDVTAQIAWQRHALQKDRPCPIPGTNDPWQRRNPDCRLGTHSGPVPGMAGLHAQFYPAACLILLILSSVPIIRHSYMSQCSAVISASVFETWPTWRISKSSFCQTTSCAGLSRSTSSSAIAGTILR